MKSREENPARAWQRCYIHGRLCLLPSLLLRLNSLPRRLRSRFEATD